jgi:hypothetical protein
MMNLEPPTEAAIKLACAALQRTITMPREGVDERHVYEALRRMPPEELDVLQLRANGTTETAIGALLGITQPAVSIRLHRLIARVRWLTIEEGRLFTGAQWKEAMLPRLKPGVRHAKKELTVRLMAELWDTGDSPAVQRAFAITQSTVRCKVIYMTYGQLKDLAQMESTLFSRFYEGWNAFVVGKRWNWGHYIKNVGQVNRALRIERDQATASQ